MDKYSTIFIALNVFRNIAIPEFYFQCNTYNLVRIEATSAAPQAINNYI